MKALLFVVLFVVAPFISVAQTKTVVITKDSTKKDVLYSNYPNNEYSAVTGHLFFENDVQEVKQEYFKLYESFTLENKIEEENNYTLLSRIVTKSKIIYVQKRYKDLYVYDIKLGYFHDRNNNGELVSVIQVFYGKKYSKPKDLENNYKILD